MRYNSDLEFEKDFSRMFDALTYLPGAGSASEESTALMSEVAIHRLFLLKRGLLGAQQAFNVKGILDDPGVYRAVLAELDRKYNDREQSISTLASFFGLDLSTAKKLAAAKDAFEDR